MDILTIQEFEALAVIKTDLAISIFLPTHRAGRETEQDPIRLKNLLNTVETQLLDQGKRRTEVETLLKPGFDLLSNDTFWRHASDGLAIYLAPDFFKVFRIPVSLDELSVISPQFHLRPLLPFFARDGHFFVLSLSQKQCILYEGTKHTIDEVEFEETLPDLAEAMKFDQFSKELQFRSGTASTSGGENAALFHGHDPSDDDKKRLLRWFQKVDDALSTLLVNENSPMVVAGVEYLIPIFKEATSYPHIVKDNIHGNPDEFSPKEIHSKAWPIIVPIFSEEENEAKGKYFELKNKGQTSQAIDEILFAAHHGKIESLFIALGEQVWGNYDLEKQTLQVFEDNQSGDFDLVNIAAVQTILNGGFVYAVEPEKVPGGENLAAIFRY